MTNYIYIYTQIKYFLLGDFKISLIEPYETYIMLKI